MISNKFQSRVHYPAGVWWVVEECDVSDVVLLNCGMKGTKATLAAGVIDDLEWHRLIGTSNEPAIADMG